MFLPQLTCLIVVEMKMEKSGLNSALEIHYMLAHSNSLTSTNFHRKWIYKCVTKWLIVNGEREMYEVAVLGNLTLHIIS